MTVAGAAGSWPALNTATRLLSEIREDPRNARTHAPKQVAALAASLKEFGWTFPMLVDEDGVLIAGHGRRQAAIKLGWTEGPVAVAAGWTEAQRRAYMLADNKLAEQAGWDEALLAEELGFLEGAGFDLELTGFGAAEFAAMLGQGGGAREGEDEIPEGPAAPAARPGDLWRLGDHRLLCGDSTDAADVSRLLGDERPHLMVTDPPYGVNYDPAWRDHRGSLQLKGGGSRAVGEVVNDGTADWRVAWALFPGDVAFVWHAGWHSPVVAESLDAEGFERRALIIWAKSRLVVGRGHYHHKHEPCWYAVRKGKSAHWAGDRKQTTLWEIDHRKSDTGHGTQKPVEAMRRPVVNHSKPGDAVYEPFCGSGTTLVACETEGRRCFAMEISPAYIDVIIERWQALTGAEAELLGDGRSFAEIRAARAAEAAAEAEPEA